MNVPNVWEAINVLIGLLAVFFGCSIGTIIFYYALALEEIVEREGRIMDLIERTMEGKKE